MAIELEDGKMGGGHHLGTWLGLSKGHLEERVGSEEGERGETEGGGFQLVFLT